jgi:large subunit ribosomal protein L17
VLGDAADMAMIELVDFNEVYNVKTVVGEEKKKTRRGRAKKVATAPAAETAPEVIEEAPVVDAPEASAEEPKTEE